MLRLVRDTTHSLCNVEPLLIHCYRDPSTPCGSVLHGLGYHYVWGKDIPRTHRHILCTGRLFMGERLSAASPSSYPLVPVGYYFSFYYTAEISQSAA